LVQVMLSFHLILPSFRTGAFAFGRAVLLLP
jgi:hypothetical protein